VRSFAYKGKRTPARRGPLTPKRWVEKTHIGQQGKNPRKGVRGLKKGPRKPNAAQKCARLKAEGFRLRHSRNYCVGQRVKGAGTKPVDACKGETRTNEADVALFLWVEDKTLRTRPDWFHAHSNAGGGHAD